MAALPVPEGDTTFAEALASAGSDLWENPQLRATLSSAHRRAVAKYNAAVAQSGDEAETGGGITFAITRFAEVAWAISVTAQVSAEALTPTQIKQAAEQDET